MTQKITIVSARELSLVQMVVASAAGVVLRRVVVSPGQEATVDFEDSESVTITIPPEGH